MRLFKEGGGEGSRYSKITEVTKQKVDRGSEKR